MKFVTRTTLFVFLAIALILSACAPIVAQGAKEIDTRTQMTPTTAPAPTEPAVTSTTDPNATDVDWKSYTSDTYGYTVKYPANWTVSVDTKAPAGSGKSPEYVTFSSGPDGRLPNITIYALTGRPPFTGYEDCKPTLVFRGLDVCQISVPAGQIPAAELNVFHNGDQFFQIALQYENQSDKGIFDLFMRSFQFTKAVYNGPAVPVLKTYASKEYGYTVDYPAEWTVSVNTTVPTGSGKSPEYVSFTSGSDGHLPNITIYALNGMPPFTGYESCIPNLVFRGLDACRVSNPAGQNPASELIVFHNGNQFFEIALQYENQEALGLFDQFMAAFQFTNPIYNGPAVPVLKTYASKEFGYTVDYPADWNVKEEASADKDRATAAENVYFTPVAGDGSVTITISAEKGTLPFSTYLACESNLVFHDLKACRITVPGGQNHVTEQLIFEKGEARFVIAMQHTDASDLEVFDRFLTSFEFFK